MRLRRRRTLPAIFDGAGFQFSGEAATAILEEVAPEHKYDEQPPENVGYRNADVRGITCGHCVHFRYEDHDGDLGVSTGVCELYEAKVRADMVSDGFKDNGPAINKDGNEVWTQEYSDEATIDREFFLPSEGAEFAQEGNLVWKDIFREGEWEITPTLAGPVEKKLTIVNEGTTDYKKGIIALSDIEASFEDQAIPYVQIPLTDTPGQDHKEMARLNQGFVKKLRRTKGEDGKWRLQAGCHFTEPETLEKVKRGTYADVSAKITPWLRKRDKKVFPAVLRHVCITNTPWIDGMTPFGVAASDDDQPSAIESYQLSEQIDKNDPRLSLEWRKEKAGEALHSQLELSDTYTVTDVVGGAVKVSESISGCNWTAPYTVTADGIALSALTDWERVEDTEPEEQAKETPPAPASSGVQLSELSPAEKARQLRGLRLSQAADTNNGGSNMPRSTRIEDRLAGLELSDDVRGLLSEVLTENQTLRARTNESAIDARVEELKGLGFADSPGALKLYRQVALADDEMPVIEFSDDTGATHSPSAKELLDSFIGALTGGKEIAIQLSEQHTTHGNDDPPPANDDDAKDSKPVSERVAAAKAAIGEK
jgi:hypothetical protein